MILSNPVPVVDCMRFLCILGLLLHVSGYVAQLPDEMVQSVQDSNSALINSSATTSLNSVTQTTLQEDSPLEFIVRYHWNTRGAHLEPLRLYSTLLFNMAAIALYDWNTAVHHIMFPSTHQIKMGFIADTRGPGLLAKHIVWTLDELFDIFVEYQKFLPGSAEIDWVPVRPAAPYSFGVASVQSVSVSSSQPSASDALAENVAASVSQKGSDIIPSQATSSLIPILALPGLEQGNSSIIPLSLISEAPDGPTNLSASPKVDVVFRFRPHGVIFQVSQVYNASQKLLIKIAEKDVSATVPSLFSTYNDMNDFTYSFRPLRVSAGDKVSYYTCVLAIQMIPHLMWHKGGPTGRWTEIDGRLLVDRIDSARFCIEKGDKTRLNPEDVCTIEPPPIGDDGGIVATA